MTNPYYTPSGTPPFRTTASSAAIRNEFATIAAGFDQVATEAGAYLLRSGGAMTGTISTSAGEALRVRHDSGYLAFWNAGNTARAGFLQFNSGGTAVLGAEGASAGIDMMVGNVLRSRMDANGVFNIGVAGNTLAGLRVRNDGLGYGAALEMVNKVSTSSVHIIGSLLWNAYRDVADPSYVGAIWCTSATPSGNDGVIAIGAAGNATGALPDAALRITREGSILDKPAFVPITTSISGVVASTAADSFVIDGNKSIASYGLTWKQLSESGSPIAVLSGYGGIKLFTLNTERILINSSGDLTMSNRRPDGPRIVLSNQRQDAAPQKFGVIMFDAYRDVSNPSYPAAIWADGVANVGNYADVVIAACINGIADYPVERLRISGLDGAVHASSDGAQILGRPSLRWSTLYASSGAINTSDAREKTAVQPLTPDEVAAAKDLAAEIGTYRFLSAIAAKGDAARHHVGMTVQRAIELMTSHGLDPMRYGFICYDEWEAKGDAPAGDRFSFRPDELLLFLARGTDARLRQLEAA